MEKRMCKEEEQQYKEFKKYILGYKGLACFLIMFMHFLGLYKYSHAFEPRIKWVDLVLDSKFEFVLNEGFWLYGFYVISGYLVAKSNISKIADLIKKSIKRFLRFAFPIMFAYLVIFGIYLVIGFHNQETIAIIDCGWYQSYYGLNYTIMDVLLSPIQVLLLGSTVLNAPYWVLKSMFFSSILIYCMKYVYNRLHLKNEELCFFILFGMTLLSGIVLNSIFIACLFGMMIEIYYPQITLIMKKQYFGIASIITAIMILIWEEPILYALFFAVALISIPKVKLLDKILSARLFQFMGNISWGVFSFHWPLICSAGAMIMVKLYGKFSVIQTYSIAFIGTIIITIILSYLYYHTFEKAADRVTKIIMSVIDKYL